MPLVPMLVVTAMLNGDNCDGRMDPPFQEMRETAHVVAFLARNAGAIHDRMGLGFTWRTGSCIRLWILGRMSVNILHKPSYFPILHD